MRKSQSMTLNIYADLWPDRLDDITNTITQSLLLIPTEKQNKWKLLLSNVGIPPFLKRRTAVRCSILRSALDIIAHYYK